MPKSYSKGKSRKSAAAARDDAVKICFEVEPIVEAKLRFLCHHYSLPYPEGIAVILEKTCALVDRKRRRR